MRLGKENISLTYLDNLISDDYLKGDVEGMFSLFSIY